MGLGFRLTCRRIHGSARRGSEPCKTGGLRCLGSLCHGFRAAVAAMVVGLSSPPGGWPEGRRGMLTPKETGRRGPGRCHAADGRVVHARTGVARVCNRSFRENTRTTSPWRRSPSWWGPEWAPRSRARSTPRVAERTDFESCVPTTVPDGARTLPSASLAPKLPPQLVVSTSVNAIRSPALPENRRTERHKRGNSPGRRAQQNKVIKASTTFARTA